MLYFFYCFVVILLFAAIKATLTSKAINAVFSAIIAFISAACLLILISADFYAFLLIILYVGTILVLFLFLVSMFHTNNKENKNIFFVSSCAIPSLFMIYKTLCMFSSAPKDLENVSKITILDIGKEIYTQYFLHFQLIGILILLAMCGIVILVFEKQSIRKKITIKHKPGSVKLIKQSLRKGAE